MELVQSNYALPSIRTENISSATSDSMEIQTSLAENNPELQNLEDQFDGICEIPPPPDDWQFNMFLDDIAEEIKTEELDRMKFYLSGENGIGKKELEKIKTPLQLFSVLKSRQVVTRDNLIYLQQLLRKLRRKDLITRAINFAKTVGNVIHFYEASQQPENGYSNIKCHVEGKNFRDCTRNYVQSLRSRVAAILFLPPEDVLIAGVEPSCSLLITLMIPDIYAEIFKDVIESKDYPQDLLDLSIDILEIHGKTYNLRGVPGTETDATDQQKKLANVYQQLQLREKQLEISEIERLRLEDELNEAKEQVSKLDEKHLEISTSLAMLEKMFVNNGESPASLASQSALKEFKNTLKHSDVQSCDKLVIQAMVNANTEVVVNRMREEQSIRERQLQLVLDELQSQITPLSLELDKYRFFSEVDIDEMDKKLSECFQKLLDIFKEIKTSEQLPKTPAHGCYARQIEPYLPVLKKISIKLSVKEKQSLSQKYNWEADDDIKRMVDSDPNCFLAGILCKEMEEKRVVVDVVEFISQCLKEVRRLDLLLILKQMTGTAPDNRRPVSRRVRTKPTQKKSEKINTDGATRMNKMAEQVQQIYDLLQETSKTFGPLPKYPAHPPPYSSHDSQYLI